jgi:adenylate kinase family enzyme
MQFNQLIERFLHEHNLPPTKFGRLAVSDPRLVLDMRNGRQVRDDTRARIEDFMQAYRRTNR